MENLESQAWKVMEFNCRSLNYGKFMLHFSRLVTADVKSKDKVRYTRVILSV